MVVPPRKAPFWAQLHSLYVAGEVEQLIELAGAVEQPRWLRLLEAHSRYQKCIDDSLKYCIKSRMAGTPIDTDGLGVKRWFWGTQLRECLADAGVGLPFSLLAVADHHDRWVASLPFVGYAVMVGLCDDAVDAGGSDA